MDNRQRDLCAYRLSQSGDSIKVAKMSDYDDFFIAGKEEAQMQIETAELMIRGLRKETGDENEEMGRKKQNYFGSGTAHSDSISCFCHIPEVGCDE